MRFIDMKGQVAEAEIWKWNFSGNTMVVMTPDVVPMGTRLHFNGWPHTCFRVRNLKEVETICKAWMADTSEGLRDGYFKYK